MQGRFAATLAGSLAVVVLAGCSSGKDAGTDTLRADSAATAAAPAADSAAAGASTSGAPTLADEIYSAENAWRIAVTGGDTVELGRITAPGFTMVGKTGPASTVTRASLMKQISQGEVQADSSSITGLRVDGSGNTATAQLTFYWRVSRMGKPPKGETMNVTDSWVKRDGRWQLASRKEQ